MPNWKKVIVSGSDAALNSLLVTNGLTVTGSLNVTGSTTQIGNNTLLGNTTLSGSIIVSGSTTTPTIQVYGNITHDGYVRFNPVSTNINPSISASYIYVSGSTNDLYFTQNGSGYANTTRLRWLEGNLYTGLLNGGLITSASSTTFNLSSGSGIIVDLNASLNDNPYPTVQYINWGNLTNQPLTYLTSSIQTFIGIDASGNIIQQTDPWIDGQYNTSISIGTVLHQNTASINGFISYPNVAYGWKQRSYDFIKAFGPLKLSGYIIYPSSSLGLTVGSGTAWADGRNYQTDPNNPSYITDPGTNVSKIFRYYVSGSTYIQDTNGGIGYTTIDPSKYNNNGVLTSISPSTPWSNQRVFYYPNSVTKGIVVYYGSATYASQTEAVANLAYENFQETPNTQQNAIYLGTITIKYNGTFTTPNDYVILPGGIFRSVGGSGGGGAITSTLSGLSDVSITGPTNGQPLVYNSSSLKWENQSTLTANLVGNASTATTASYALTASYIVPSTTNAFVQNGNSFGTTALLGTNDNQSLALETSGSIRMFVSSSGLVGINKTTPNAQLDVNGNTLTSGSSTWVLPGNANGYISPGTDGISIGNGNSGVHIRVRNSNRTNFDQSCGFGSPGFGQSTSDRITILTGGTTSTQTGLWVGSSANTNIFKVQGDSKVAINKAVATSSLDVAGTTVLSGSFNTAASGSILTVIGSGSAQPIFTVQGSQGELFSITDSLSGSLFSVNDISGLPILEVFSDSTTLIGNYYAPALVTTAKVVQTNSGSFTVYSLPTASYDTAFFEYSIKSGSNARAGTIMAIQLGSTVNFTETTTTDFGDTTAVSFTVIVTGSNMALTGSSTTGSWTTKCIVRGL